MRPCTGMRWITASTFVVAAGAINLALSWGDDADKAAEAGTPLSASRSDELRSSLIALAPVQKIAASDNPLTRARKERYNAAVAQLVSQQAMFESGGVAFDSTLEPLERLAKAAEPVQKRDEYLRLLSQCVVVGRSIESAATARAEGGFAPTASVHAATFVRANLEVRLLEAQSADKK